MIKWKNLQELLNNRGEKAKLSKATNISSGNITDWFNPNKSAQPSADALIKIAEYYKCTVDFLMDRTDKMEFNIMSTPIYRFPVYKQQASAGAGITGRDGKFLMYDLFTTDIPQNAVFGVHIKGNSMVNTEPQLRIEDIPDGSIVLLNSKVNISDLNKTIVVASINDEVVCKYFLIEKDGWRFYSLNRIEHAGDDRFVRTSEEHKCRIIGQVVKVVKPSEFE